MCDHSFLELAIHCGIEVLAWKSQSLLQIFILIQSVIIFLLMAYFQNSGGVEYQNIENANF